MSKIIEALRNPDDSLRWADGDGLLEMAAAEIERLEAALAEARAAPAAEPVAWALIYSDGTVEPYMGKECPSLNATPGIRARPLVWGDTAPPPVSVVSYTDDLIRQLREIPNFNAGKLAHRAAAELSRLTAEHDALKAEAEALRKDAERYRWLRDGPDGPVSEVVQMFAEEWDAAIDAAIAAKQRDEP